MTTPYADLQDLNQSSGFVELFTLDATKVGGGVYRFTNFANPDGGALYFGGNAYIPLPVKSEGWDFSSTGTPPKPTLTVSNVSKQFLADVISLGDLVGSEVTRVRTFAKYLDAATFTRRNLFSRTQEFDNAAWLKVNTVIASNAVTAPDGTVTADRMREVATTPASPYFYVTQTANAPGGNTFTCSCYLQAAERTHANLRFDDGAGINTVSVSVNLATGTLGLAAASGNATINKTSLTEHGNGWYRLAVTATWAAITTVRAFIRPAAGSSNHSTDLGYLGDITKGINIWGAQLEKGDVLTPYQGVSTTVQPYADSTKYIGPEVYVVEQKTGHNSEFIQWQLTSILDRFGMKLPRRQILKDKGFPGVSRTRVVG